MKFHASHLLLLLVGCSPLIRVPDAKVVAPTPREARAVELCVLYQERGSRTLVEGVAEFSFSKWDYAIASILVKHPRGLVVIDPAFGRDISDEMLRGGPFHRVLFGDGKTKQPLVDVLANVGLSPTDIRFALTTHLHFDHTGALGDLSAATVLVPRVELEAARHYSRFFDHGVMPHHLVRAKERMRTYEFPGPAMEGFPASFDVFQDGSVLALPMPGHTAGSTGFLVRGANGHSYLLSGDTTWTRRGVELPAHKNPLVPLDADRTVLSDSIGLLHAFFEHRPDVTVIPAHDASALSQLPECSRETVASWKP